MSQHLGCTKMRRLRRRKKMIGIKQLMAVNWNAGASSVPSYESFTIPSPHDFLSKETPGSNMDSSSLTGRKRPVSGADHIHQESSTFETQLQHALGKRCDIDVVSASQQPLVLFSLRITYFSCYYQISFSSLG